MKVALTQPVLDHRSPARTVQALLAAIRTAAGASPAPDLVILPGGSDSGGVCPPRDTPAAVLAAAREAIALQAREWGVYIAAGLHRREGAGYEPYTALFDRDGDMVLGTPGEVERAAGGWLCMHLADAGDVGCYDAHQDTEAPGSVEVGPRGALVLVCVPPTSGVRERRGVDARVEALPVPSSGGPLYWAFACCPGEDRAGGDRGTCLVSPNGRAIASTSPGDNPVIAEVPITPATEQERISMTALRDYAN